MKIIFFASLIILPLVIIGCSGEGDCRDNPQFLSSNIGSINVRPLFDTTTTISTTPVSLALEFRAETVSSVQFKFSPSFSLFNKAHATSCPSPQFQERITYINITSDSNYDDLHMAGQSLNEYFEISTNESIEDTLYSDSVWSSGYWISLNHLPTLDKTHNFQVTIELDSGSVFTAEVDTLTFQ